LRAVKQFEPTELIDGFDEAGDRLLSATADEASFGHPVTAAIDNTTVPYYGDVEGMPMVSGIGGKGERASEFATLSIVGETFRSFWQSNPSVKAPLGTTTGRIRCIASSGDS